jgi:hypothetical protein
VWVRVFMIQNSSKKMAELDSERTSSSLETSGCRIDADEVKAENLR